MKRFWIILTAALAFFSATRADDARFTAARDAYDDGRFGESAKEYGALVSNGVSNVEVRYNLANALFKNGDLPNAVSHYRVAWHGAPRDPDIQANLRFALNAAGAVAPEPSPLARFFSTCSRDEWIVVGVAGYGALTLVLIVCMLARIGRRATLKASALPLAALGLAAAGWAWWARFEARPEWVVTSAEATTLYGPVEGSTAHYKLPLGALARQTASDPKGWVELEYDGKRGWIKTDQIRRISLDSM